MQHLSEFEKKDKYVHTQTMLVYLEILLAILHRSVQKLTNEFLPTLDTGEIQQRFATGTTHLLHVSITSNTSRCSPNIEGFLRLTKNRMCQTVSSQLAIQQLNSETTSA